MANRDASNHEGDTGIATEAGNDGFAEAIRNGTISGTVGSIRDGSEHGFSDTGTSARVEGDAIVTEPIRKRRGRKPKASQVPTPEGQEETLSIKKPRGSSAKARKEEASEAAAQLLGMANFGAIKFAGTLDAAMGETEWSMIHPALESMLSSSAALKKTNKYMMPAALCMGMAMWSMRVASLRKAKHLRPIEPTGEPIVDETVPQQDVFNIMQQMAR